MISDQVEASASTPPNSSQRRSPQFGYPQPAPPPIVLCKPLLDETVRAVAVRNEVSHLLRKIGIRSVDGYFGVSPLRREAAGERPDQATGADEPIVLLAHDFQRRNNQLRLTDFTINWHQPLHFRLARLPAYAPLRRKA
jgi:hypothetical protein